MIHCALFGSYFFPFQICNGINAFPDNNFVISCRIIIHQKIT